MTYTTVALKNKILEMYPDIEKQNLSLGVVWNGEKNAYVLKLRRKGEELVTFLDKMDADDCMNNIRCVHLGIKVDQFVRNIAEREEFGRRVA